MNLVIIILRVYASWVSYVPRGVCVVHHRQLDLPRCCDPLRARPTSTRDGTGVGARHVRRLDPRNLLSPRNARRQLDRQGQGTRGGWVRRFEGGLEGQAVFVY